MADYSAPAGAPIWFDLTSSDPDRADEFNRAIFGREAERSPATWPTWASRTLEMEVVVGVRIAHGLQGKSGEHGKSPIRARTYFQSMTAMSLRSVIGRASSCSTQMRCRFSSVSSSPGPSRLPGVKVAGRCRMPWMTPMLS